MKDKPAGPQFIAQPNTARDAHRWSEWIFAGDGTATVVGIRTRIDATLCRYGDLSSFSFDEEEKNH